MKSQIILESKLTPHQKTHISVVMLIPVFFVTIMTLVKHFEQNDLSNITLSFPRLIPLVIALIILIMLLFLKEGILKKNNDLYQGTYLFGKLLIKKKVSLLDKPKVAILKLRKRQKMAWFSIANPDQALSYHKNDITLLNDKHTRKELLVSLDDENLANKTISFLEENFNLTFETYSPDFN